MKEKDTKVIIILLMGVIIVILAVLCVLFATNKIHLKDKENKNVNNTHEIEKEDKTEEINQEYLLKLIDNELFIFFMHSNPNRKISELDNQSKLYVALSKLKDQYTTASNDLYSQLQGFSSANLEEAFNSTCISNLGIQHEDIDEFQYNEDNKYYNNTGLMTKIVYRYMRPHAKKVTNFNIEGSNYYISIKYLFPDDQMGYQYYYGDLENKNQIVKAYEENGNYIDAQKYLDENFDNIKNKLATYNYTFEYKNNKLSLIDFSIN